MVLPSEPEFEQVRCPYYDHVNLILILINDAQAVQEITSTLAPFIAKHPEYQKALDIVQIPERIVQFRVVWENDKGEAQVNRGYRVQVGGIAQRQ